MSELISSLYAFIGIQKLSARNLNQTSEKHAVHLLIAVICITLGFSGIILAFAFVWTKYPQFLYLYRDGEYNLWISLQTGAWTTPFDLTSINPLQGMTSMLVTINPYFDPGQWVFKSELPQGMKVLISYAIYTSEVLVSTLVLGLKLGFSRLQSFVASIWTALLLFPPFNFFFGLGGWFAGAPMFGHTLAITNLCLIICLNIGDVSYKSQQEMLFKNLTLIALLIILVLTILIAAPFYNAGLLLGIGLLLSCICLCSNNRRQFFWRVFAGVAILATFYLLGLPEFYMSAKAYSARFTENQPFLAINLHNLTNLYNHDATASAWAMLCAYGVHCPAFPGWPISISTIWVNTAIIMGGVIAWLVMPQSTARLGILIAFGWISLLVISALMSLGVLSMLTALSWFYLMMYSLCALYSLCILFLPIKILLGHAKIHIKPLNVWLFSLLISLIISSWIIFSFHGQASQLKHLTKKETGLSTTMMGDRHPVTPIIQLLQKEVALFPGEQFRGSVATIYGTREGTLRKESNVHKTNFVVGGQFEEFLTAAAESGSSHDLLDLWTWNIPTLSEYGQGISRPLLFYIAKFLSSPEDAIESHFVFPHKPNIDVLRALGVRFVIIDTPLLNKEIFLRQQLKAGKVSTLYLYELSKPNLGNYSPTHLVPLHDASSFYHIITADPNRFESEAFVDRPISVNLTPAYDAKIIFKKRGIHVTAKSNGTSALLLPIQFSHCYRIEGRSATKVKIMRANLIHTLLIFTGNLDANLIWEFRWKHSHCRLLDVYDVKNLKV